MKWFLNAIALILSMQSLVAISQSTKNEIMYKLNERFIDDTEIYEFVNSNNNDELKKSITMIIDNSASMGDYTTESLPIMHWDHNKLYQLPSDNCDYCDNSLYTSSIENHYNDNSYTRRGFEGIHLLQPLFKQCSPETPNCIKDDRIQQYAQAAWPLVYPNLIFDGFMKLGTLQYSGICTVNVKIIHGREFQFYKSDSRDSNNNDNSMVNDMHPYNIGNQHEVWIPVKDENECKNLNNVQNLIKNKNRILKYLATQKGYIYKSSIKSQLHQIDIDLVEPEREHYIGLNSCGNNANSYHIHSPFTNFIEIIKEYKRSNDAHNEKFKLHNSQLNTKYTSLYYINERMYEYQTEYESDVDYDLFTQEIESVKKQKKDIEDNILDIESKINDLKWVNLKSDLFNETRKLYSKVYDLKPVDDTEKLLCDFKQLNSLGFMSIANFNFRNYILAKKRDKTAYFLANRYELVKDALKFVLENYIEDNTEIRFVLYMMGINGSNKYDTQRVKVRAIDKEKQNRTVLNLSLINKNQYAHLGVDELMTFKNTRTTNGVEEDVYEDINEPTAFKQSINRNYLYTKDKDKKKFAEEIINDINTHGYGGGTPTSDALWVGYQLAKENLAPSDQCHQANKIMLFTDGDANLLSNSLKNQVTHMHNSNDDLHKVLYKLCQQFSDNNRSALERNDKSILIKHQFDVSKPEDACSLLISEHMGNYQSSNSSNQHLNEKLPLYAVGFKGGLSKEGEKALHLISHANRKKPAIMVQSNEDLKQVFKQVLNFKTLNEEVTVSPVSPPTAGGGISRGDTAFFGLFKPMDSVFWDGNIKCYKVDHDTQDSTYRYKDRLNKRAFCKKNNVPKDCLQSGQVNPSSFDYFNESKVADGGNVLSGGILSKMHLSNNSDQNKKVLNLEGEDIQIDEPYLETYYDYSKSKQKAIRINDKSKFYKSLRKSWKRANKMINQRVSPADWTNLNEEIKQKATYWLMGLDSDGKKLRKNLGDFLHTEFEVINYEQHSLLVVPSNDGFIKAYKINKNADLADIKNQSNTGELVYNFIPKELFDQVWWRIGSYSLPFPNISKFYGFDGPMEVFHMDTNLNGVVDNEEKAYIIVGMRRGGNSYYLFDISKPFIRDKTEDLETKENSSNMGIQLVRRISGMSTPLNRPLVPEVENLIKQQVVKYEIDNTDNNQKKKEQRKKERRAYSLLAQTWSKPSLVKVPILREDRIAQKTKPPLGCDKHYCYAWIFGGGYNPNNRDKIKKNTLYQSIYRKIDTQDDYIGNAVYLVNAATGKLLWWASSEKKANPSEFIKNLQSIPSGITAIDVGGENGSATDAAFFNDIEGNVFRINFYNFKAKLINKKTSNALWRKIEYPSKSVVSIGKLNDQSENKHKRFVFYEPVVTFLKDSNDNDYFAVGFGTGYRPSPKQGYYQNTQNRVGVIFDYPVYSSKLQDSEFAFDCSKIESGNCLVDVTKYTSDDYLKPNKILQDLQDFNAKELKPTSSIKPMGWYIDLDADNNEKMISSGIAVKGYFAFETFLPNSSEAYQSETQCIADLGNKRLWLLDLSTGKALEKNERYFSSGRSLPAERLNLIKYRGEYLITGTGKENSGQDLIRVNVERDSKQKLGIREAIPTGSLFYQEVSID